MLRSDHPGQGPPEAEEITLERAPDEEIIGRPVPGSPPAGLPFPGPGWALIYGWGPGFDNILFVTVNEAGASGSASSFALSKRLALPGAPIHGASWLGKGVVSMVNKVEKMRSLVLGAE